VFSLDHRVLYANDALMKMWGRGYEGTIGKTFLEIGYEPWHAQMHEREIDQVRATRQPVRGEVPFTGTLGRRHYEYIFVPVIGADGEVEAVAGTTRDVTARHEADAALRESEERSAFVRRSSDVGFWYCDLPFDVLQWDELVKAHFHLPPDASVTIQTFYDRIHPDDRERVRDSIARSIEGRTPYKVDYRTVDPDTGAIAWVRAIGRTFYGADGTPTRFDGITLDVTDQKLAEERQNFLIRLADTLRPLSDPVAVQAEASRVLGEYLGANRVLYFEITDDEYVIERDYTSGVRPLAGRYPVAAFGPALLAELLDGRTVIEADATRQPDRSPEEQAAFAGIQVRGHVDVPLVKNGEFVGGMTVHFSSRHDWTPSEVAVIEDTAERTWAAVEQVRVEAALRASEERRRLALDAAELGSWHIDLVTDTFTTDERFRIIFSGSSAAMDYAQAFACIHPDDQTRVQQAVTAATRAENPVAYAEEYRLVHPNGAVRWVFAKGRVSYDPNGSRLQSLDGTVADITARKRIEEEQARLVEQLREQDRRKDVFLATLAHELRNPLAPIRNGLHVMKLSGASGAIEAARAMMERQLTQLVRLVDDLLDVSRVTSGKLELRKERVSLAMIVEAAVETARPYIEQAGHKLSVDLPDEPITLLADPTRLAQVVANLLNNAAKYTPRGGHVQIAAHREGTTAVLVVADDGIGIPPVMLGEVFKMFTQVDRSLEKSTGGLGIGLSLVKGLVELHGGTVDAHSDGEALGAKFVIRLPAAPTESTEKASLVASSPVNPTRHRVLIADDNADSADSLGILLEMLGNDVSTANDGAAAVDLAERIRPNVILLDIAMPKLNGYEACRRIREQPWATNVCLVAMTGWGQREDKLRSQEAGFDLHLVKPVDPAALQTLLSSLKS
jgi:PAS domain S-box-containing protein